MIVQIIERILLHSSLIERLLSLISDVDSGKISEEDVKREIVRIDEEEDRLVEKWDAILNSHNDD